MSIFISYSHADEQYAEKLESALSAQGYKTWFAPKNIDGGDSFIIRIATELSKHRSEEPEERIEEDCEKLQGAECLVLLLSENSMKSKWVRKEFLIAEKRNLPILVLQIDHYKLTKVFEALLIDTQIVKAYRLHPNALKDVTTWLNEKLSKSGSPEKDSNRRERLTYEQIGIVPIVSGDSYFVEGETLRITLGNGRYYLAPPKDMLDNSEYQSYLAEHSFHHEDVVFDSTLQEMCRQIPIAGLYQMIEDSRRKVFLQFLNKENGCYFNNGKYGVASIDDFVRTEDLAEQPILNMELFQTDYYTHRIMKDVCKQLAKTHRKFIRELNFGRIGANRILLTSLGVNLILSEKNERIILTSRSTNAAETYKKFSYSLSAIEGVSVSDYDTFNKTVNVQYSVFRGLKEELGVDDYYLKKDSLYFYDLFVNPANLEIGLSCSVELKPEYTLKDDIIQLHGKDEKLEVADKKILETRVLADFIYNNIAGMMPQAVYTLCTYLESLGIFMVNRMYRKPLKEAMSVIAKDGSLNPCGDRYVWNEHYIAVIDGATPKGEMLWDGCPGDVFVSHLIADTIVEMNPEYSAIEAITHINDVVKNTYKAYGVEFSTLRPEERLQCSLLIYSVKKHEVWSFGDCMLRINHQEYRNLKEGDQVFAALRAFCIQIERDRRGGDVNEQELSQYGRQMILPYLKEYTTLANRDVPFGYDVIDGGTIHAEHVKVYAVQKDDYVVMASDGYPHLFDTLEDTENYLKKALSEDPICVGRLRGTKGVTPGNQSYDDRTYLSFRVS